MHGRGLLGGGPASTSSGVGPSVTRAGALERVRKINQPARETTPHTQDHLNPGPDLDRHGTPVTLRVSAASRRGGGGRAGLAW